MLATAFLARLARICSRCVSRSLISSMACCIRLVFMLVFRWSGIAPCCTPSPLIEVQDGNLSPHDGTVQGAVFGVQAPASAGHLHLPAERLSGPERRFEPARNVLQHLTVRVRHMAPRDYAVQHTGHRILIHSASSSSVSCTGVASLQHHPSMIGYSRYVRAPRPCDWP